MINKQFKIILVFIVFFGLISFPFFTENVKATFNYPYGSYGFEDTVATYQVTSSESDFFTTYNLSDAQLTHVDTTYAHDGTKSYRIHDNGEAIGWSYWNCTLNENINDISNVSWWVYIDQILGSDMAKFYMYDNNDTLIWNVVLSGTVLQYVDHNGVDQTIRINMPEDEWFKIWVQYNAIDSVDYGCEEIGVSPGQSIISGVQPRNVVTEPTFKQLRLWVNCQASAEQYWVDNFNVTFGDIGESETDPYYDDYCLIGDISNSVYITRYNRAFIECQYDSLLPTTIRRISLIITEQQYDEQPLPNYYIFNVNGNIYNFANIEPIRLKQKLSGDNYQYVWGYILSKNITYSFGSTKKINLAFGFTDSLGNRGYWNYIWFGLDNYHGDNNINQKYHDSILYFQDINYNGEFQSGVFPWLIHYDCTDEPIDPSNCDSDTLYLTPSKNNTYYYEVGEGVIWRATSSTSGYTSTININLNGSAYNVESFYTYPFTMTYCEEKGVFTPLVSGSYNITHKRLGVTINSINFTVNYPLGWSSFYAWSEPNPSKIGGNVKFSYRYFHAQGYDGYGILSSSYDITETSFYLKEPFRIYSNTTGDFFQRLSGSGDYYFFILAELGSYNTTVYTHIHNVGSLDYETYLRVQYPTVTIYDSQYIFYAHDYKGHEVYIKKNGENFLYVGGSNDGSYSWTVYDSGEVNMSLEVLLNNTWVVLKYTNFDITGGKGGEFEESNEYVEIVNTYLNDNQQFILGFVIIGIAMFLPLYINHTWNEKYSVTFEIPPFVYVVFIIIGFSFDIYLELFDMWTLVLVTFVIICVVVWQLLSGGYLSRLGIGNKYNGNDNE